MTITRATAASVPLLLLLAATAMAQIPIPTKVKVARRHDKVTQARAQLEALRGHAAIIKELKKWASINRDDLRGVYGDALDNFRQAREAIYRAKGKTAPRADPPKAFEVAVARLSGASRYPTYLSYRVPTVDPDNFYIHVQAEYPTSWVAERRRMKVTWYIFDDSYLPMASPYQNEDKAIYRDTYYSKQISSTTIRYRNQVRGLGLMPGRYFVAAVFQEPVQYGRKRKVHKYQKQVSLAAFRVVKPPPPGVKVLLPHYPQWYQTHKSKLSLDNIKARGNKRAITISGSFDRADFAKDVEPAYLEVTAGYNKRVIYRDLVKIRRATKNRLKATIKDHALGPGAHRLRVTLYTAYATGRKYYRPYAGSRAEQSVDLQIK